MPQDQKPGSWYLRATWLGLIFVVSLAIADAALAPTPTPTQPDFIDTILASRAVVVATRIAIVFAAAFVVLSVIALIGRRQWLTRLGPVEVLDVDAENQQLDEELETAEQVIEDLESRAAYAQQVVDKEQGA